MLASSSAGWVALLIWAAAVEEYGIINWLTMLQHEDPFLQQYEKSLLGDPEKDRAIYDADSPLTYIKNATAPLLVLQGDNVTIDLVGATLATLGLGLLVYGLIAMNAGRITAEALGTTIVGTAVLCAFVLFERRTPDPMVRCDLFASRDFSAANIYTFFLYTAIGGSLYFVPFVLINVHHYSPTQAGAALLPFIFIMVVAARWSGGLVARIGPRKPLILGGIIAGFGFLAFALPGSDGSYWTTFFPAATILGCGGALFVAPLTTTVMNSVPVEHSGVASGVNNAVARTAGLIGVAVLGVVVTTSASYIGGFRGAMIASALLAFAASGVAAKGFARFQPSAPASG